MKNGKFLLLAGILALAISFGLAGCGLKGGSVTVTNVSKLPVTIGIATGTSFPDKPSVTVKLVNAGGKFSEIRDEDGVYLVLVVYGSDQDAYPKKRGTLTGGESVYLTWDGTNLNLK